MSIYVPGFDGEVLVATNVDFSQPTGQATPNITILGQILMGSGVASPAIVPATLFEGPGISIVPSLAPNRITISAVAAGFVWQDLPPALMTSGNGYFCTGAGVYTLPTGVADGEIIELVSIVGAGVVVTSAAAQTIQIANGFSSTPGAATSTLKGDSLQLVFRLTDLTWYSTATNGNWILT